MEITTRTGEFDVDVADRVDESAPPAQRRVLRTSVASARARWRRLPRCTIWLKQPALAKPHSACAGAASGSIRMARKAAPRPKYSVATSSRLARIGLGAKTLHQAHGAARRGDRGTCGRFRSRARTAGSTDRQPAPARRTPPGSAAPGSRAGRRPRPRSGTGSRRPAATAFSRISMTRSTYGSVVSALAQSRSTSPMSGRRSNRTSSALSAGCRRMAGSSGSGGCRPGRLQARRPTRSAGSGSCRACRRDPRDRECPGRTTAAEAPSWPSGSWSPSGSAAATRYRPCARRWHRQSVRRRSPPSDAAARSTKADSPRRRICVAEAIPSAKSATVRCLSNGGATSKSRCIALRLARVSAGLGVVVERVGIFAQELADAVRPKVEGRVATQEGHGRRQGRACVGGEPFGQHAGRRPSLDVARQEGSEQRSAIGIGPGEKRRRTDGTAIDLPFEQSQPVFTTEAGEARQVAVDFAAGPHARQLAHQWLVVHRKRRNADDELQLVGRRRRRGGAAAAPKTQPRFRYAARNRSTRQCDVAVAFRQARTTRRSSAARGSGRAVRAGR